MLLLGHAVTWGCGQQHAERAENATDEALLASYFNRVEGYLVVFGFFFVIIYLSYTTMPPGGKTHTVSLPSTEVYQVSSASRCTCQCEGVIARG